MGAEAAGRSPLLISSQQFACLGRQKGARGVALRRLDVACAQHCRSVFTISPPPLGTLQCRLYVQRPNDEDKMTPKTNNTPRRPVGPKPPKADSRRELRESEYNEVVRRSDVLNQGFTIIETFKL